jgi:hypothetical protein
MERLANSPPLQRRRLRAATERVIVPRTRVKEEPCSRSAFR